MGLTNAIFGNYGSAKKPEAPRPDIFGGAMKFMNSPFGQKSKGEQVGMNALNKMEQGLGGFTSPEQAALYGKESSRRMGALGATNAATTSAMAKQGVGGGFAAEAANRARNTANRDINAAGRDLTISNIQNKQNLLNQYAAQAKAMENSEMARRAFAMQGGVAQTQGDMDRYNALAQMYGADKAAEGGGLLEGAINAYTYGLGGNIYRDLMSN